MHHDPGTAEEGSATVLWRPGSARRKQPQDIARYVVVVEGSEAGKKLELGLKPLEVGRHGDNQLVLADAFVSNRHCRILFEAGTVWVIDLDSTNGTFVGEVRVRGRAPWPDGSCLSVGSQVLRHEYRAREEVERSSLLAEDLRQAADYVRSLLPAPLRSGPVTTAWHSQPSTAVGGDVFDYHWLDEGCFAFHLLDVCGHGVGAALHSASVANLIRRSFLPRVDFRRPAQVLKALNDALPMELYGSMYFTLWYGVLRIADRCLTYASAGHPPALLFWNRGRNRRDLATDNPPIGMMEGVVFQEVTETLEARSSLYLYSDGVFEITTKSGQWWSSQDFSRYLQRRVQLGRGSPEEVYQAIRAMTRGDRFEDDFSLLEVTLQA